MPILWFIQKFRKAINEVNVNIYTNGMNNGNMWELNMRITRGAIYLNFSLRNSNATVRKMEASVERFDCIWGQPLWEIENSEDQKDRYP